MLFTVDAVLVDGLPIPVEPNSVTVEGILGFEKEGVAEASGNHDSTRKAIVPTIKMKVLHKEGVDPLELGSYCSVQVILRQQQFECKNAKPRRLRCSDCETASVGAVGGDGKFDWEVLAKGTRQWL